MKRSGLLIIGLLLAALAGGRAQTYWIGTDANTNLYVITSTGTTNLLTEIIPIPTNPVVSQCSDYVYNSDFAGIDVTRPTQNELGYTLGCALVETRTAMRNWILRGHDLVGNHKAGSISYSNLDASLKQTLSKIGQANPPILFYSTNASAVYITTGASGTNGAVLLNSVLAPSNDGSSELRWTAAHQADAGCLMFAEFLTNGIVVSSWTSVIQAGVYVEHSYTMTVPAIPWNFTASCNVHMVGSGSVFNFGTFTQYH